MEKIIIDGYKFKKYEKENGEVTLIHTTDEGFEIIMNFTGDETVHNETLKSLAELDTKTGL